MSALRTPLRATLAALIALAAGALVPRAAAAQADSVVAACYVPTSGSVYRIKTPDTPQTCTKPAHVEFSWRRAGYASTVMVKSLSAPMPVPSGKFHSVACPAGRTPVGGGYNVVYSGLTTRPQQISSQPHVVNGVPQGWGVGIWNPGPSEVRIEVFAICFASN